MERFFKQTMPKMIEGIKAAKAPRPIKPMRITAAKLAAKATATPPATCAPALVEEEEESEVDAEELWTALSTKCWMKSHWE